MVSTPNELGRKANDQRRQLSEDVASYVRELIMSGRVRPGDFLRTEPIAEAVGVSNTPVREGLLLLRGEGLVELVRRRGFMVASFTRQDIHDLFWAQASLAAELTSRATRMVTPEQLAHLSMLVENHEQAVRDDNTERVIALGHDFHRTINVAADSRRLATLLGSIVQQLPNRFYNRIEGRVECVRHDHPEILDAMEKRRPKVAATAMRDHILSGADQLIASLENQGMWSDEADHQSTA